jgi:hypothetical protein
MHKKMIKKISVIVLSPITLIVMGLVFIYWGAISRTNDVNAMCNIPNDTPIELVMKKARELKFDVKGELALGSGFELFNEDEKNPSQWSDDSLPGIQTGKVKVGKVSLPPLMRNYCEISFKDRKTVGTRSWTLD